MEIRTRKLRREYEEIRGLPDLSIEIQGIYDEGKARENLRRFEEKTEQIARIEKDELVGLECVQAYVSNMSASASLGEMERSDGRTLPEKLLSGEENEWTAPKWAKAGDIVFFMHTKTARTTITRLRTEINQRKAEFSKEEYEHYMSLIDHGLEIHAQYGGKIFAIARVCGAPEYAEPEEVISEYNHWKSREYAMIDNVFPLKKPIDIADFREYILISRGGSVTPLYDEQFNRLREQICKENELPDYIMKAVAKPIPLRRINDRNWFEIANDYRRSFILERQFRSFYIDYLIRAIGDRKKFYTECRCCRPDIYDSFMDYVFLLDGHYLPVEAKLAVSAEKNITGQVSKYVYNTEVFQEAHGDKRLDTNLFYPGKVLIIDTEALYLFDAGAGGIRKIFDLGEIRSYRDVQNMKDVIRRSL